MQYEVICLKDFGINNIAFDLPSVVSYMYEAVSHGLLVLGGDIIVVEKDRYVESYDNWFSEKKEPLETMQDALDYLTRYWKTRKGSGEWYVSVVLGG